VVRGTVPDHAVVGGVPAKVIKEYVAGAGWLRPVDALAGDAAPAASASVSLDVG
jgi:hypothetical protein